MVLLLKISTKEGNKRIQSLGNIEEQLTEIHSRNLKSLNTIENYLDPKNVDENAKYIIKNAYKEVSKKGVVHIEEINKYIFKENLLINNSAKLLNKINKLIDSINLHENEYLNINLNGFDISSKHGVKDTLILSNQHISFLIGTESERLENEINFNEVKTKIAHWLETSRYFFINDQGEPVNSPTQNVW